MSASGQKMAAIASEWFSGGVTGPVTLVHDGGTLVMQCQQYEWGVKLQARDGEWIDISEL